jgi:hypothetical protein
MRQYQARLAQFEHPCVFFQRVDDLVQRSLVTSNHWQPRHAPCTLEHRIKHDTRMLDRPKRPVDAVNVLILGAQARALRT